MFVAFMRKTLQQGKFDGVFERMVDRPGIFHRYSVLPRDGFSLKPESRENFYAPGSFVDIRTGLLRRISN